MKSLRNIFTAVVVLGAICFLSRLSFADEGCAGGKMNHEAKVKLLKDSATALQQLHPELAKGLNAIVDKEAKELQEMKANHESKMKLLLDAAAALEKSNPDLAKGLEQMSETRHKKAMQSSIQEKNEKEEVGEKAEPTSEQDENIK